jgi:hypothetical protein
MAGFTPLHIEDLRSIEWSKDHLWDARLFDVKSTSQGGGGDIGKFTKWFPATTVDENLATLNNHTFEGFLSTYSVPLNSSEFTITLGFYDDEQHSIVHWLTNWINNGILNGGKYVTTANEAKRSLQIRKFTAQHKIISNTIYWVIPDGELNFEGSSESGIHEYSMTFKVLGVFHHSGH